MVYTLNKSDEIIKINDLFSPFNQRKIMKSINTDEKFNE